MRRKICAIGNSRGVSLPPEILDKLHLAVGSDVEISLDERSRRIILEPAMPADAEGIDADFVGQVNDFIEQYRPALKKLAE
ncbi:AbrB/MazE/SpoVT family DNA-binding domain-containing protein [Geoalkalibacter halelectricus]|jgi:antitoxin MazE|uniref:AbrB/MazE/SpoVT family DNA-binding domain-containing protein n=1 Tax=Geoalkalibacter halelectricus TaxID=2847045 RepID=UPI003D22C77B